MKSLIVLTGQTATGKTGIAEQLAQTYSIDLILADSRQVYEGLHIVSGLDLPPGGNFINVKDSDGFCLGYYKNDKYRIWLVNAVKPTMVLTAHHYAKLAQEAMEHTYTDGRLPVLVGGSYFYLSTLLYSMDHFEVPPQQVLRSALNDKSVSDLQRILTTYDPRWLQDMNASDRGNPRRLIRRIEIASVTEYRPAQSPTYQLDPYFSHIHVQMFGYAHSNDSALRSAIETRVRVRIAQGAADETAAFLRNSITQNAPVWSATGCAQLKDYLTGKIDKDTLIQQWAQKEISYAKRQMTSMQKDPNIKWLAPKIMPTVVSVDQN